MRMVTRILLIALLALVAGLALAADPEPQKPADPKAADQAAVPDIDINRAEIDAGVAPDPDAGVKSQLPGAEVPPMIAEIRALMDARRLEIAELAAQAANLPNQRMDVALQRQVAELKQQTELDILAIQARYARADGNEELALRIEADIAAIISPPAPEAPTEARPKPNGQH